MKQLITMYFDCWLKKDASKIAEIFSKDIVYSECYGPQYFGLGQIIKWFNEWNKHGTVLKWDIKQFIIQENMCVVEWYFECEYENKQAGFDGISVIEFDNNRQIVSLKEFQSKAEHNYPYGTL